MRRATRSWRVGLAAGVCAAVAFLSGCFLLPNDPPVASFTATPGQGSAPLTVSFDASGSYDPDGSVTSYRWSFGDGAMGYGAYATHVYAAPGIYTAELTVQDFRRATSVAHVQIEVQSGTKYAIIMGVALYPPPQVQLSYTDDDAVALGQRLATLPGWDPDNILVLTNAQATLGMFSTALEAVSELAGPDDLLLIHFSGHGTYYQDGNGDEADGFDEALLFFDAPLLDDSFALLVDQLPMRRVALFIDTCYSGGQLDSRALAGDARTAGSRSAFDMDVLEDLDRIGRIGTKDLDRVPKQLVALAASRFDEVSWEVASLRTGCSPMPCLRRSTAVPMLRGMRTGRCRRRNASPGFSLAFSNWRCPLLKRSRFRSCSTTRRENWRSQELRSPVRARLW